MSEYYAVERSPEYLMHYGIRGMRWGVRRAIKRGDQAALRKHYMKAAKKLGVLSLNANRGVQERNYKIAKARMIRGAAESGGMSAGLTAALNVSRGHSIKNAAIYGGIAGLTGATAGALLNSKGIMSKRWISDKGHNRAIEKRNQWRRDMESTFKGTSYGGKEQKKFHQQITALSDAADPRSYTAKQAKKAQREVDRLGKAKKNAVKLSSSQRKRVNKSLSRALESGQLKPYKRKF